MVQTLNTSSLVFLDINSEVSQQALNLMAYTGSPLSSEQAGRKEKKKYSIKVFDHLLTGNEFWKLQSRTARDLETENNLFIFYVIKIRSSEQKKRDNRAPVVC